MSVGQASDPGELSFSQAMDELESVLRRIEDDQIDIDQLASELGRAAQLLDVCRKKIRRAEVEVQQIVEQIEEERPDSGDVAADSRARSDFEAPADDPDDEIPF